MNIAPGASDVARRMLLPTPRSDLRVSWHAEIGVMVVSLWRDGECVGSARLSGDQAGELAAFAARHLGAAAVPAPGRERSA